MVKKTSKECLMKGSISDITSDTETIILSAFKFIDDYAGRELTTEFLCDVVRLLQGFTEGINENKDINGCINLAIHRLTGKGDENELEKVD